MFLFVCYVLDDQVSETVSPNSHVYSRTVSLNSAAPDAVHKSSSDGPLTNRSGAGQVPHHRKMRDFPTLQGSGLPQTSNRLRSSKEMGVGPDVPEIQRSQNGRRDAVCALLFHWTFKNLLWLGARTEMRTQYIPAHEPMT